MAVTVMSEQERVVSEHFGGRVRDYEAYQSRAVRIFDLMKEIHPAKYWREVSAAIMSEKPAFTSRASRSEMVDVVTNCSVGRADLDQLVKSLRVVVETERKRIDSRFKLVQVRLDSLGGE